MVIAWQLAIEKSLHALKRLGVVVKFSFGKLVENSFRLIFIEENRFPCNVTCKVQSKDRFHFFLNGAFDCRGNLFC